MPASHLLRSSDSLFFAASSHPSSVSPSQFWSKPQSIHVNPSNPSNQLLPSKQTLGLSTADQPYSAQLTWHPRSHSERLGRARRTFHYVPSGANGNVSAPHPLLGVWTCCSLCSFPVCCFEGELRSDSISTPHGVAFLFLRKGWNCAVFYFGASGRMHLEGGSERRNDIYQIKHCPPVGMRWSCLLLSRLRCCEK